MNLIHLDEVWMTAPHGAPPNEAPCGPGTCDFGTASL